MRFTDQQLTAIERRDSSILVSAGAGHWQDLGAGRALRARRARRRRGRGVDSRDHVHREGGRPAQAAGARRRFVELNQLELAREAEAAWISTIHGFCARVLRTHALAAGIDPEFRVLDAGGGRAPGAGRLRRCAGRVPRAGRERGAAADDRRLQPPPAGRHGAHRLRPPAQPGQGAHAAGDRSAASRPASARRWRRPRPSALAEIGAPELPTVARRSDKVERCAALLDRLEDGALAEHGDMEGLAAKPTAKALKGPAYAAYLRGPRGIRRAVPAPRRVPRPRAAARADRAPRRPLRDAQARPLGAGLRRPRAAHPRPAARRRGPARPLRRALHPRAGGRVPGHQPAAERDPRAAGARQPVPGRRRAPVDLPLPPRRREGVPRRTTRRRTSAGRPRRSA